ncbi:MAG: urease accessory UreF family protein [Gemmataceae bacterium]
MATATAANELLHITLTPPTLRHASAEMGDQLLRLAAFWDWAVDSVQRLAGDAARSQEAIPWHHAAVFAVLARAAGASPREALSVYLHQGAVGVLSAGVRAIPIGHTHGQQALSRLHDEIEALADEFVAAPLESAGAGAPAYEITCHEQSGLYSRLFRS